MSPPLFVRDHPKLVQELGKVGHPVPESDGVPVNLKQTERFGYDVIIVGGGALSIARLMPAISHRLETYFITRYGWMRPCCTTIRESKRDSASVRGWRKVADSK